MNPLNSKTKNVIGKTFNRLTVLEYRGKSNYLCQCECGTEKVINRRKFAHNHTKSCGCLAREEQAKPRTHLQKPQATERSLFNSYRSNANRRQIVFELSFEEFAAYLDKTCFYCGADPSQLRKDTSSVRSRHIFYNGIDRLDPELGYSQRNCVTACGKCNYGKRSMTLKAFGLWITAIYKNMRLEEWEK